MGHDFPTATTATPPTHLDYSLIGENATRAIERGLATAGRTHDDLEITVEVIVGVGRNDEELEHAKGIRNLLAFYGSTPSYKPVLDVEGWGELQPELNALSKKGDWATMATLITDDMISTIGVYGTPDQVAEEIVARYGAHASRVCAYFPFYEANDGLIADVTAAIHAASS